MNGMSVNNWKSVQLKPLSTEQAAAPHFNNPNGKNIPAAAIPTEYPYYEQPQQSHGFRNFVLKSVGLLGVLYGFAKLKGKHIDVEKAGSFKKAVQKWSKHYSDFVDKGFKAVKNGVVAVKNKIVKPKNAEEAVEETAEKATAKTAEKTAEKTAK